MSYRTTAILLALLAVLAGAVYYLQQQPTPQEASAKASNPQIVTFNPSDATKVVISSGDKSTELAKDGTTWNLVKPLATPADAARVEGWMDQIGSLSADRVLDNVTDLNSYGLSQPKLNVEVGLTGGKSVILAFGDKTPDGSEYYVRLPDNSAKQKSVFIVSAPLGDDLKSALTTPPKALPTPKPQPTLAAAPTLNVPPTPKATPTVGQ